MKLYKFEYNLTWSERGSPHWKDNVQYYVGKEEIVTSIVIPDLKEQLLKVVETANPDDIPHGSCQVICFTPDDVGRLLTTFCAGFQLKDGETILHRTFFVNTVEELNQSIASLEKGRFVLDNGQF